MKIPGFAANVVSGLVGAAPRGSLIIAGAKTKPDAEVAAKVCGSRRAV